MAQNEWALCKVIDNRKLTQKTDGAFLALLQKGVLLALLERNLITERQLYISEEILPFGRRDEFDTGSKLL